MQVAAAVSAVVGDEALLIVDVFLLKELQTQPLRHLAVKCMHGLWQHYGEMLRPYGNIMVRCSGLLV